MRIFPSFLGIALLFIISSPVRSPAALGSRKERKSGYLYIYSRKTSLIISHTVFLAQLLANMHTSANVTTSDHTGVNLNALHWQSHGLIKIHTQRRYFMLRYRDGGWEDGCNLLPETTVHC